jgi:glycosyltransferase involved in cell wall biosynthesis
MTLGKKRNLLNEKAKGDYIIYMDDDDYYPPERISHAVDKLKNDSNALCAGSSAMYIYFKHINKMLQFGPYGPNHSTAATFAFKKELLKITKFDENSSVAEERTFLKDYKIPFVQLESIKSILVFSHNHNSFDKKELLMQMPNPHVHETKIIPSDIIKEPEILNFFINDINYLLDLYEPGKPIYKPDVTQQLAEIKEKRENMIKQQIAQQNQYQSTLNSLQGLTNPHLVQNSVNQHVHIIQQLTIENKELKEKNKYLENKLKQIIDERIKEKIQEKKTISESDIKIIYS